MAFDSTTRGKLQRLVTACRNLLTDEFDDQLQSIYGIYADDGRVLEIEKLASLDDDQRVTGALLRERIAHLQSGLTSSKTPLKDAVQRVLRDQAFTVLNRFAALRMAEERELVLQCVGDGLNSKGFQVFENVASPDLGSQYERYSVFLGCLFDELSLDLGILFDRFSPLGLLFPCEPKLKEFLQLLNDPELKSLWREDETIGWIYQYFNDEVERKKMREESSAPRNSRELAVRNQFFTPRYVVEFLTDNTLGRLWNEMTRGETVLSERCRYLVRRPTEIFLKPGESAPESAAGSEAQAGENLSQEELLRQPVHIPHRPLKDPREIRLLDPACGSMHFGLYAFDLFTVIYDEAWEIAHGPDDAAKSAETFAPFVTFANTFPDKAAFLLEVARLIVECNIHGIDIDPRATQIAGLSLWLRAQRAWHQAGAKSTDRPRITRSNLVCAEPMPGEKELLREFVEQQFPAGERPAFAFLLEKIFDRMTLAGEAGSLLRIEEEIRAAIAEARDLAQSQSAPRQARLFPGDERSEQAQFDLRGLNDEQFWQRGEQRIYDALEAYAEQAENGRGFQRRLFADDAAQGFAFIDLCRKRYDVVVMNPPFGELAEKTVDYLRNQYPLLSENLYCGFITRASELSCSDGYFGAITDRSYLIKQSFERLREWMIKTDLLTHVVDLGWGVLDANVETCAVIFHQNSRFVSFVDVGTEGDNRPERLARLCWSESAWTVQRIKTFQNLPFSAFSYSMPSWMRLGYEDKRNRLSDSACRVCRGMGGANAEQLYRTLQEIGSKDVGATEKWVILQKGSPYSPFYYSPEYLLLHEGGTFRSALSYDAGRVTGREDYGKPGLAFGKRTDLMYAFTMNAGQVFSLEGQAIFPLDGVDVWQCLAVLNSSAFQLALNAICGQHKMHGYVNAVHLAFSTLPDCSALAKRIWGQFRNLDLENELSLMFICPIAVKIGAEESFLHGLRSLLDRRRITTQQCEALHYEINQLIATSLKAPSEISNEGLGYSIVRNLFGQDGRVEDETHNLITWTIGVLFGRWDIRYATGERPAPELPDPFAPLPACPPGMLQGDDGLPLSPEAGRRLRAEGRYPLDVAWDGILVDDPEHPLDLERRVHTALAVLWGDRADALEHEACALLGVPTLREWFRRPAGFFAGYSKSRRQAPIYWPLSTASGSYTLWLYYHRLNDQTLYTCVTDFVKPKLDAVTADADRLQARTQTGGTAKERAELQELRDFQSELQELHEELLRVAQLPWRPNLNDGVLVTASPLWKLFRLPKWQKDLKACWEELAAGDYNWAHLAYTIWPDRVREKCKTDRPLAIAHGLEGLCEVELPKLKAKRGKKSGKAEKLI